MTTSSCTGPNPHLEILSYSKNFSDDIAQGALASGQEKTPSQVAGDLLAEKVFNVANSAIRSAVLGPAEVVAGPILEAVDDALPRNVSLPLERMESRTEPSMAECALRALGEDTYTMPDVGISFISQENAPLAESILQGIRDVTHICARPAEAMEEGLSTDAAVELIVNTIKTVSPETRTSLGLDAFAADLESGVQGEPRKLLSLLVQGAATVGKNVYGMIPEAQQGRSQADRSLTVELAPTAGIRLDNPVGLGTGQHSSATLLPPANAPFTIPEEGLKLGGDSLSSSIDVLLHPTISLPDLVGPGEKAGGSSQPHQETRIPTDDHHSTPSHAEEAQGTSSPSAPTEKKGRPGLFFFPTFPEKGDKAADEGQAGDHSSFDLLREEDRPPDFNKWTGECSWTPLPDRLAELKGFANLCAFNERYGWPKERREYEMKVRRNKLRHREEKASKIDVDVKIAVQKKRVEQAKSDVLKAETLHASTKRHAFKISESLVNYEVELELLNRFLKQASEAAGEQARDGGAAAAMPTKKAEDASSSAPEETTPSVAPKEGRQPEPSITGQEAATKIQKDIQSLEAKIQELDAKIQSAGKEERRADKRVRRYKKSWRKLTQKVLHTVAGARSPKTVVEEEQILGELNHAQKQKVLDEKAVLTAQLNKLKEQLEQSDFSQAKPEASPKGESTGASDEKPAEESRAEGAEESRDKQRDSGESSRGEEPPKAEETTAPQDPKTDEDTSNGLFAPLKRAQETFRSVQKKVVDFADKQEEHFGSILSEGRGEVDQGVRELFESKRLEKIAGLIDDKLAQGSDRIELKTKDGKQLTVTREQAQQLKEQAMEKAKAKTAAAAKNVIEGASKSCVSGGAHSAAHRFSKEVKKIDTSAKNALGSAAGSAVVEFGLRCCSEGKVSGKEAAKAVLDVGYQTTKSVTTQVIQNVARSTIKGVVREAAPEMVKFVPGVTAVNNIYAVSRSVLSSESLEEGMWNGASTLVDIGISTGCTVAAQALCPIPVVGAFAGSVVGTLVIHGKNYLVRWFRS